MTPNQVNLCAFPALLQDNCQDNRNVCAATSPRVKLAAESVLGGIGVVLGVGVIIDWAERSTSGKSCP